MTLRRLPLALALVVLAGGGLATIALTRSEPLPEAGTDLPAACTTCDARAAAKKDAREALRSKASKAE